MRWVLRGEANLASCRVALLLASTVLSGWPATLAWAQAAGSTSAQRSGRAYGIPAGPLPTALARFSETSGLQLLYEAELARGLTSPGATGTMTDTVALGQLLAGTELGYRFAASGTVTLYPRPVPAPAAVVGEVVQVPQVDVSGGVSRGYGPAPGYVPEVSATGTKTDTPIIETPQSVSVVTRQQLDDQRQGSLHDAMRYTPGVTTTQGFNRTDEYLTIRGFNAWAGTGSIYRDGLRLGSNAYTLGLIEPYGLERIDVLRGPASVLFGQSEAGGLINLVSKRPTLTPFNELELSGGSYNNRQIAGDFTGPLTADGVWSYRLTGLYRDSDTQIDHLRDNRRYVAPALTWRPDRDISVTFLGTYSRTESSYNYGLPEAVTLRANRVPTSRFIGERSFDRTSSDIFTLGYLAEHRFNEAFTVRQNLRYLHADTELPYTAFGPLLADRQSISRLAISRATNSREWTVDNQAEARLEAAGLRHTVLAGLDYSYSDLHDRRGLASISSLNLYNPVYAGSIVTPAFTLVNFRQITKQLGLYAQDQVRIGERLILTGGIRQDFASSKSYNRLRGTTASVDDSAFTWRLGAVYLLPGGFAPYASYARSFLPNSGTNFRGDTFDPTEGEQYEVGIRWQPEGRRSLVSLAAYQLTKSNVLTTDLANTGFSTQTGEIRARGIEAEARAELTENFRLIANYTYTDAVVTRSNGADLGRTPAATPKHSVSFWGDLSITEGALRGIGLGGGARYLSSTENTANSARVPDYVVFDAAARYDFNDRWRLSLNAINLADRQYVATCTYACFYGDRLTLTAALRYRW